MGSFWKCKKPIVKTIDSLCLLSSISIYVTEMLIAEGAQLIVDIASMMHNKRRKSIGLFTFWGEKRNLYRCPRPFWILQKLPFPGTALSIQMANFTGIRCSPAVNNEFGESPLKPTILQIFNTQGSLILNPFVWIILVCCKVVSLKFKPWKPTHGVHVWEHPICSFDWNARTYNNIPESTSDFRTERFPGI